MRRFFSCLQKKEIFDDSVTTLADVHGLVNGFFPGHLWDNILWLWSCSKITNCRQVARHGWVEGKWRWKVTGKLVRITKSLVLRTPTAD